MEAIGHVFPAIAEDATEGQQSAGIEIGYFAPADSYLRQVYE
jgi:hypothetical protein